MADDTPDTLPFINTPAEIVVSNVNVAADEEVEVTGGLIVELTNDGTDCNAAWAAITCV
jgi:hypothetical protein